MTNQREPVFREKGDTLPKILKYNCEQYGDKRKAMRHKHHGIWQPYTWKAYYLKTKYLALGLLSLGFEQGDKVLIVGNNAPQWYFAELAAQANHGASVGVHPELTPPEIKYISEHSDATFAIAEDQEQVDKLLQIKSGLPRLKRIVYWNYKGLAQYNDPILTGYRQVLQLGEKFENEHPGLFERNVETGTADDICAIVYTSGTTGTVPTSAAHTYGTMTTAAESHLLLDPWSENDTLVSRLPPVSITEQCFGIGCHLLSACTLDFTEGPETHQRDTREIEPSIVCDGTRQWERRAAMVQTRILGSDALKRLAFRSLMPIGYQMADLKYRRQKPSLFLKLLYAFADVVLFKPIRTSLGLSNARLCYSSGAMLNPEAAKFYHALNVRLENL